jgi:primase-polymerase (primpol)-like protein
MLLAHNIPDELKARRQWVCSLVSSRKKPVQANGRNVGQAGAGHR